MWAEQLVLGGGGGFLHARWLYCKICWIKEDVGGCVGADNQENIHSSAHECGLRMYQGPKTFRNWQIARLLHLKLVDNLDDDGSKQKSHIIPPISPFRCIMQQLTSCAHKNSDTRLKGKLSLLWMSIEGHSCWSTRTSPTAPNSSQNSRLCLCSGETHHYPNLRLFCSSRLLFPPDMKFGCPPNGGQIKETVEQQERP